jgi:ABC-type branched-subunit amino acid transport system ATPase component
MDAYRMFHVEQDEILSRLSELCSNMRDRDSATVLLLTNELSFLLDCARRGIEYESGSHVIHDC